MSNQKERESVILTVDIVVVIGGDETLLISRAKDPYKDKLVLVGGHFEPSIDESLEIAVCREAEEEINLKVLPEQLKLLTKLDAPNRDPRQGRRISIVFRVDLPNRDYVGNCKAGSDAEKLHIRKINSIVKEEIGFDHWEAIKLVQENI